MYRPYKLIFNIDKNCFQCKKPLGKNKHWFFGYDHCFCSEGCRKYFIAGNNHLPGIKYH